MPPIKTSAEIDPVTHWAEEVADGAIVQGPHVRAAARRHLRDLERGRERGLVWDVAESNRRIELFPKYLRLNGGEFEGVPFELHPTQKFRIGSLFGWKRDNGERRFRRFYDEEGKGNGKSPLLAGIGYMGLVFDSAPRAEIYAAARTKEQVMTLFRDAVAMRDLSPALKARVGARGRDPVTQLVYVGRRGDKRFFSPVSSDDGKSGPRPYMVLLDELHEHRNSRTYEMFERGLSKVGANTLIAMATNSGHDRKSFCFEQHLYAIKVAAGDIEDEHSDRTFAFVCGLDPDDDWSEDESCWQKANPLLGVKLKIDDLREAVKQAKAIPGTRNEVARLHFCEWTESHTVWIARETLQACEDPSFDLKAFEGEECFVALDLGARRDMTGLAVCFRDGVDREGRPKFALWAHGYTPKDTLIERARLDQAPYPVWVRDGHITATPGSAVRLDHVARMLANLNERFVIRVLAYDNWSFEEFEDRLAEIGLTLPILQHPQGTNKSQKSPLFMPDSIANFEDAIYEKRLRVAVNPALRAAIMSATFYTTSSGLRRFDKPKATARIDLGVAAAMAIGAAVKGPADTMSDVAKLGIELI